MLINEYFAPCPDFSIDRLFTEPITVQSPHNIKELAVYFALEMNQDVEVVDIYLGGFSFNCTTIRITTKIIVFIVIWYFMSL